MKLKIKKFPNGILHQYMGSCLYNQLGKIIFENENEEVKQIMADTKTSPNHYIGNGVETIDYLRGMFSPEEFQGYCSGNIIKYVTRYKHKNGSEDLKKAKVYLDWLIKFTENLESKNDLPKV